MSQPEPFTNVRSASTTGGPSVPKIRRPRRAQGEQRRRQAAPHRLAQRHGPRTPVTLTLRIRTGSEAWLEVITDEGRFFVPYDCSAFALVEQVIKGGHWVEPLGAINHREHNTGKGHLSAGA